MVVAVDKIPPQSIEAEQSVLGSMIIDREAIFTAAELIREDDFYRTAHQKIFGAIIALNEKGEPVDLVTLADELQRRRSLEDAGGMAYLSALAGAVPTAANVQYYTLIVRDKAILRSLIRISTKIVEGCYEGPPDVEEFLDATEQQIFEVGKQGKQRSFVPLKEVIEETFERIEQVFDTKKAITGVSTGFADLDEKCSGLHPSDLVIVAARPGMGKTTLALNIAQHMAVNEKKPVAFFSLEMSRDQLAQRMLCAAAKIDAQNLRNGRLSQEEWMKLTRACGPLSESPIYIDDSASLSVMEVRAKARRLKAEKGLEAVFVDYLQLMRSYSRTENRQQELSEISRSLKALAKELSLPVIALSQLSRAVEKRTDRRPILSDLMESGGIEANADLVVFIYRDSYYSQDPADNLAEVIIAKQRNGPTGTIKLYFMNRYNRFANIARSGEIEAAPGTEAPA